MRTIGDIQVLLVDDNAQVRTLLQHMLRAGGVRHLLEADSALDALATLRDKPIDLVILDWEMKPMDGLSFARTVRWDEGSPSRCVPILMLTAHTEQSRVVAARDAGVHGFVRKPVSAQLLFERIASALTDARPLVSCATYFGPNRRRGPRADFAGPWRRQDDALRAPVPDTVDLDDERWCA